MNSLIQIIKDNRQAILIGEIGALLHDIGKCHPDFLKKNSLENIGDFRHTEIDKFLNSKLIQQIKDKKFKIKVAGNETDAYSIIKEHHNNDTKLIKSLKSCDRLDSADDKGIVREKQSIENTVINSPFGYLKEKIDLNCLQNRLDDLSNNLIGLFEKYISDLISLTSFRKIIINNLKTTFAHALGETRIPSNDVALWDHSHSTASLFKSVLCGIAIGKDPDPRNLQWRILGFCWDGIAFIDKGIKVADILKRNDIIELIKNELKKKFEDEIPIGNTIYEDTNGIYFTFPELEQDGSAQLAEECAKIGLEIIRRESDNEIWPFFTLTNASRTLTIISVELKFSSEKRKIPKMSPTLFVKDGPKIIENNPNLCVPKEREDICSVCQFRPKPERLERCEICEERRKGRAPSWLSNRESTIWIDEVADRNNRIALLTLSFDLDKWLDGTMIGTIYSQSFEDWINTKDAKKFFNNNQNITKLRNRGIIIDDDLVKLSRNTLKIITDEEISKDIGFKSDLINTFFEDISSSQNQNEEKYVKKFIDKLKSRLEPNQFNSYSLQRLLFTQNPSPARIYRIWKETEEFFDLIIKEIKDKIYSAKWKRIKFSIEISDLDLKNDIPYIIKIKVLEPENILVFHSSNGVFYTIEPLEKFGLVDNTKRGIEAVEDGLKNNGFYSLAKEDDPNTNLIKNQTELVAFIKSEEYYPFIEITKSPLYLRLILPALDSIRILNLIAKLYNERFKKVIGKLPLNTSLLVAKRKFPLYVLLDASERMLSDKKFKESKEMDVWWDIAELRNDKYYGFYPDKKLSDNEKYYNLDDLSLISKGKHGSDNLSGYDMEKIIMNTPKSYQYRKHYTLYPGYFDFDLLHSTTDRYKINYDKNMKRIDEDYRLLSSRPYYFYQISQMIDLWEILSNNLSSSQINFVEEMFMRKLIEWRAVNEPNKEMIFREFTIATLKDAFAEKWYKLSVETRDLLINSALNRLLLDTITLFKHIIKVKEVNESG